MLTKEEVKNIAVLARIGLGENEIEEYQKRLSAILDYFQKLKKLDTGGVEPIGHITGRKNFLRADKVCESGDLERADILKNAPEISDGFVKVKSVL